MREYVLEEQTHSSSALRFVILKKTVGALIHIVLLIAVVLLGLHFLGMG